MAVVIGVDKVHYALLLTDAVGAKATYSSPKQLPGAISANINPNGSSETLFADNGPFETASTIGRIELALNVADLSLDEQAVLLGSTINNGILIRKGSDTPPWLAIGFRSLKSNGKYRYTWLAKGKFTPPEQNNETKGDSINFQTPTINGSFVQRESDQEWERHIDEDSENFTPTMASNWFKNPFGEATT